MYRPRQTKILLFSLLIKDHLAKKKLKTDITTAIAATLTENDLLKVFADAVEKAQ